MVQQLQHFQFYLSLPPVRFFPQLPLAAEVVLSYMPQLPLAAAAHALAAFCSMYITNFGLQLSCTNTADLDSGVPFPAPPSSCMCRHLTPPYRAPMRT